MRALVLGGTEEVIRDDTEVDTPESREALSEALSEFMTAPLAAKSLGRRLGCVHKK